MALTQEQKKEYIKRNGCFCAYCGEDDSEFTGQWESDADYVTRGVRCLVCNKTWTDHYTLTDIIEDK